nr:hypothetical protein [uncultured Desulfobulbus sp.]
MKIKKFIVIGLAIGTIFSVGIAVGAQLHMQNAMALLQNARHELQQAPEDTQGHRARALKFVNQAVYEIHAGMNSPK